MKHFLSFLLLVSLAFFSTPASADYFEEQILDSDPETSIIEDITLQSISLKEAKEMKRYTSTRSFINSIKTEAVKRFNDGTIPLYRRYDIITSLDSFVYTMNQYFLYQSRYEQTKNTLYKNTARSYLDDSRWAYSRLRASLKKSTY